MHQPALDRAAWASRWRTRNVGDKALLSLGLLIVAVSAPVWPGGVAAGAMAVACALVWARVPVGIWARAVAAPTVFIAVGVLAVAISLDTSRSVDAVWRTGPIAITTPGLVRAAELVGRGFAGMTAVVLLAATTPMVDLLTGLRRLRIPDELIEVAALTYRMLFLFAATAGSLHRAQAARLGTTTLSGRFQTAGRVASRVFVLAWDRARRLEAGLAGRGYTGALRTVTPPRPHSMPFLIAATLLVTATAVLGWFPW